MDESPHEPASVSTGELAGALKLCPRKSWLAGLLAVLCPGLGHLYTGRALTAFTLCWLPRFLLLVALSLSVVGGTAVLSMIFAGVLGYAGIYVAQVVSAVMHARRAGTDYVLRRWNHAVLYVGFVLFAWLATKSMGAVAKEHAVEVFKVPSAAMLPSVLVGDHVLVAKVGDLNRHPRRGDVVVFRAPNGEVNYLTRVIGLAGDEVSVLGGVPHINGRSVERALVGRKRLSDRLNGRWMPVAVQVYEERIGGSRFFTSEQEESQAMPDFGPVRVPEGSFFVLGDFRDSSLDSRSFGTVPDSNFVGTARVLLFSYGDEGPRFERIGMRL